MSDSPAAERGGSTATSRSAETTSPTGRRDAGARQKRPYPLLADDVARSRVCVAIAAPFIVASPFVIRNLDLQPTLVGILTAFVIWSIYSIVYIGLVFGVFMRADADTLGQWLWAVPRPRTRAQRISGIINGYGAIWWALSGGGVSIAAMIVLMTTGESTPPAIIWAGVVVLTASWAIIAVSFAVHYAREHALSGGLEFPGEAPRFSDFLYLSLQLSTTFAGSDVVITTTRMRRFAALHGGIAFLFNTVIIAILVTVLLAAVS
ncbi:DUF1345 domain-containing protein [Nonomuraea insulae]|uniref:DUF1345 domain-containing protein n=1 Tax=Nonomuraea insulae TaxID=1616787 RepID=A0ABW1CG16_9ACTN